jgi:hypothetical protein
MQKALPATFFSRIIRHPTIILRPTTYDAVTNYDAFPPLLPLNALTNYYAPPVYGYVAPPAVSYPPPVYGWVLVRPISCGKYRYWNGEYCADARNALPYVGPR